MNFFDEFHVVDLIRVGNTVRGVVAVDVATGEFHIFHAKAVNFATVGGDVAGKLPRMLIR